MRWLDRARDLRILVTSRVRLGLPGEEILDVAPLSPDDADELFLCRARAAHPGFAPSGDELRAVRTLTGRLDGLPLALELAAVRVRALSVQSLTAKMDERFRLLSGPDRTGRHATLLATLDASWDLLSEPEQSGLAQLSVFRGGASLSAAEAVLDLRGAWPADILQGLVDNSLLRRAGEDRFDLLDSVQEYARDRLEALGGTQAARRRHAAWFQQVGDRAGPVDLRELSNLVAACRWAIAAADGDIATGTLRGAVAALDQRGPLGLGVELSDAVRALPLAADPALSALTIAGWARHRVGRTAEARALFEDGLQRARAAGARAAEGDCLLGLATTCLRAGRLGEAREANEAALPILEAVGDRRSMAEARLQRGMLLSGDGRNLDADRGEAVRAEYLAALELSRSVGDRALEGRVVGWFANVLLVGLGRPDDALEHYRRALALARESGNRRSEGNTQCDLGNACTETGRLDEAHACYAAALAILGAIGARREEGWRSTSTAWRRAAPSACPATSGCRSARWPRCGS